MKQRYIIIDVETDSFAADKLWVVCTKEYPSGKERTFRRPDIDSSVRKNLFDYLDGARLVGHHILGFDLKVLVRHVGIKQKWTDCVDTLVTARLKDSWTYSSHSLKDWGQRLGVYKKDFHDFSELTDEMVEYCIDDVRTTYSLFIYLLDFLSDEDNTRALELEHNSAFLCQTITDNGFMFDISLAGRLYDELSERHRKLLSELQEAFPPKSKLIKEIIPKETKNGTISKTDFRWLDGEPEELGYYPGGWFSRIEFIPFNPGSAKQRIEILDACGWKPFEKTKGHIKAEKEKDLDKLKYYKTYGWKTNEDNLNTLPKDAPEAARKLVEYLTVSSRISTLEEWFSVYNKETGRIHGSFHHIGSWTHRKSHSSPNQANVLRIFHSTKEILTPVEEINFRYNGAFRECFRVPPGRLLIGTDAEGIQLRVLAHYLDNEEYTKSIVDGKKEDGTDIHTVNQKALGLKHITRNHAKTFIYAWLLGAGIPKVSNILECSIPAAGKSVKTFIERIEGLNTLKNLRIPRDAERGYFLGLDGRKVVCPSAYKMLAGYLQNGESVIMKWANRIWVEECTKKKLPFWQVNDVHDEWQTETLDDKELAEEIALIQRNSIRQAGIDLGMNVRLDGSSDIGKNWKETH